MIPGYLTSGHLPRHPSNSDHRRSARVVLPCWASSEHHSVVSCRYSHKDRDAGVSDHSMVIVEVD